MNHWRHCAAIAAALGSLVIGSDPSLACERAQSSEVELIDKLPAEAMYRAAASVEIVEMVGSEPVDLDALTEEYFRHRPAPIDNPAELVEEKAEVREGLSALGISRIEFRVIERLKGREPDRFTLRGSVREPDFELSQGLTPGRFWEGSNVMEADPRTLYAMSCRGLLTAYPGERYLIFRKADGSLLTDAVRFRWRDSDEVLALDGLNYERIVPGDPWLAAVRQAAKSR